MSILFDRFFQDRMAVSSDGCWLWGGSKTWDGYAVWGTTGGKHVYAHRVAYEREVGPILEGLTLDHLCRVRHCINPAHLEPVTLSENVRRGNKGRYERKTHCKHGHELSGDNLYLNPYTNKPGKRPGKICRICNNAAARRWQAKQKEAA